MVDLSEVRSCDASVINGALRSALLTLQLPEVFVVSAKALTTNINLKGLMI